MDSLNLIVISGGSGTGKSTLAQALQEQLLPDVWLHFSVDAIFACLPQSIIQSANAHNDWSRVDAKAVTGAAQACLRVLLAEGHKLLFECVVASEVGAKSLLLGIGDARPAFVGLTCSWEKPAEEHALEAI